MRLSDVMHRGVATVKPSDGLSLAVQVMAWSEVRHLPVLEGQRLVGLLSEHDLLRHRESAVSATVATAMSSPVHTAAPDEELPVAAHRMLDAGIGCLPVLEDGRLVGIVTRGDLLSLLGPPPERTTTLETRAWALMTTDPLSAHQDDYLLDAAGRMSSASVRHLPVVDSDGVVTGMLSDRDVRRVVGDLGAMLSDAEVRTRVSLARVGEVASRAPLTVRENTPLNAIAALMSRFRIGAVPVLDDAGRLTGIVSYLDVIGALTGERPARSAPERGAPLYPH